MNTTNKKTILLVEDEALIAMAEKQILEKYDFNVITTYTGEETIKIIKENLEVALILMDIYLGDGLNGTETAKEILKIRELPIVFLTSHSEKEMVDKVKK